MTITLSLFTGDAGRGGKRGTDPLLKMGEPAALGGKDIGVRGQGLGEKILLRRENGGLGNRRAGLLHVQEKRGDCVLGRLLGSEWSCENRFHKCEPELRGLRQLCLVRSQMLEILFGATSEGFQMQVEGFGKAKASEEEA